MAKNQNTSTKLQINSKFQWPKLSNLSIKYQLFVLNLCFWSLGIICNLRFVFCYFRLVRIRVCTATSPSRTGTGSRRASLPRVADVPWPNRWTWQSCHFETAMGRINIPIEYLADPMILPHSSGKLPPCSRGKNSSHGYTTDRQRMLCKDWWGSGWFVPRSHSHSPHRQ